MAARNAVDAWLRMDNDKDSRLQVETLRDHGDLEEMLDAFGSRLQFGTAGLRALEGPGYNRMNPITVQQTTQGLVKYLQQMSASQWQNDSQLAQADSTIDYLGNGIVIGYDGRTNSRRYAEITASVFLSEGIQVHMYPMMVGTPLVACAVQHLKCAAGVMVTASHNPAPYNGYKVYYCNGCQIIPPHDAGIASQIESNTDLWTMMPPEDTWNHPLMRDPTELVLPQYFDYLKNDLCLHRDVNSDTTPVVYTPLHGVGLPFVQEAFKAFNLPPPILVPEQAEADASFPTTPFPNPEEGAGVWDLSFACAEKHEVRLVIANDPDADRLAVAERLHSFSDVASVSREQVTRSDSGLQALHVAELWRPFSGNEIGILLAHWLWTQKLQHLEQKSVMFTTVVSSGMLAAMGEAEGFEVHSTLTGFKWLANWSEGYAKQGWAAEFSFEEAIGFSVGSLVRDKDGISSAAVFAEMAGHLYRMDSTLSGHLNALRSKYGYFEYRSGYVMAPSPDVMNTFFSHLRSAGEGPNLVDSIAGVQVLSTRDLGTGVDTSQPDQKTTLPWTEGDNFITFFLKGNVSVSLRASGTEPKLKYYVEALDSEEAVAVQLANELSDAVMCELIKPQDSGFIV